MENVISLLLYDSSEGNPQQIYEKHFLVCSPSGLQLHRLPYPDFMFLLLVYNVYPKPYIFDRTVNRQRITNHLFIGI
jgi:hypothetical protein